MPRWTGAWEHGRTYVDGNGQEVFLSGDAETGPEVQHPAKGAKRKRCAGPIATVRPATGNRLTDPSLEPFPSAAERRMNPWHTATLKREGALADGCGILDRVDAHWLPLMLRRRSLPLCKTVIVALCRSSSDLGLKLHCYGRPRALPAPFLRSFMAREKFAHSLRAI